jgi:FtsZ-binding cell division protein ZapB
MNNTKSNAKDIAEKILNCKTYDIPDIQSLARAYLELKKRIVLLLRENTLLILDSIEPRTDKDVTIVGLKKEITNLKEENETLSKDLKMCREIGVEMQREVNRKLSTKYEKSIEALKKIKDLDYRGNISSESIMAFNILNELGEL